jgi:hypothetical protein
MAHLSRRQLLASAAAVPLASALSPVGRLFAPQIEFIAPTLHIDQAALHIGEIRLNRLPRTGELVWIVYDGVNWVQV